MNTAKPKRFIIKTGMILLMASFAVGARAAELPQVLVPVGQAVGISIKTDGVIVHELSELKTEAGTVAPARDAGILPGDIIVMVNGQKVACGDDMLKAVNGEGGKPVAIKLMRCGKELQVTVTPVKDGEECFLGLWIRDSLTGIGTVTYYDPASGDYGALGHSISDNDTGAILPLREGEILTAEITGVTAGKAGSPGQLGGVFDFENVVGDIDINCQMGIFGDTQKELAGCLPEPLPVAGEDEIQVGSAVIYSQADGEVKEYDIEITRLFPNNEDGRNMMIKVTDPELKAVTGGIVQGMSGSPIIQNGKIIGAVTHVLINDPERGYGIFIENMLDAAA